MTQLTQKEATAKIATLTKAAHELIAEAEGVADEHGLSFSFDLAYGMGGTYYGESIREEYGYTDEYDLDGGWRASSNSC